MQRSCQYPTAIQQSNGPPFAYHLSYLSKHPAILCDVPTIARRVPTYIGLTSSYIVSKARATLGEARDPRDFAKDMPSGVQDPKRRIWRQLPAPRTPFQTPIKMPPTQHPPRIPNPTLLYARAHASHAIAYTLESPAIRLSSQTFCNFALYFCFRMW